MIKLLKGESIMILDRIRNKKVRKKYEKDNIGYASDGSLIEDVIFEAKNKNLFIIRHMQYADEDGNLTMFGIYKILNKKEEEIGNLKYVFDDTDCSHPYMKLCDIYFNYPYRNIGIGSKTLELFEKRAHDYGALHIEGTLSEVDASLKEDKMLRDTFYQNAGYTISGETILKNLS